MNQADYNEFWAWFVTQPEYHRELVPTSFGRFTIGGVPISELCSLSELEVAYKRDGAIGMYQLARRTQMSGGSMGSMTLKPNPNEVYFCTRCGEKLDPTTMQWLELNTNTGNYAKVGEVPADQSQGCFTFGAACARRVLKANGVCDYKSKKTFR